MRNVSRMRLAEFILANIEPILNEWEIFARSVNADGTMDELALRDHAEDILRATARDMMSHQTGTEQLEKSKGQGQDNAGSRQLDTASAVHAVGRVHSGFDLMEVLSEY